ncbi:DedA family protein [Anaeromicropila herbilytica]|uniref:Membrane protein n=1 Tax=Anaeromicropila herbilytica TaxID=2785025 RepID=A0A7R7IED6_9FIRM|nr:DedA family protein [Anaeromicropila herbilytica]BCN31999.1 membrane protein [Anaeromicropila herbilytica]
MQSIIDLIYEYGLPSMFVIILLEYACFPVSSEIVLPFSGAIASTQNIRFTVILFASVIAGILGTCICYSIGRYGGSPILERIKRKFPKSKKPIDTSLEKFNQYGSFAVCFGRVIPLCRTYIAFVAGAAKQNIITFLVSSLIGITVWNTILIGLGYTLRENWSNVGSYYHEYKAIFIPLIAFLIIILILRKKFFKKIKT